MTLWSFELRKMFKMNRGGFVVALFIIAELVLLILGDAPVNADAALYREEYLAELKKVEGPWTPEKAALLESEAREAAGERPGFDVLYKQYLYVNEGRDNRFFLDANGWAGLLADRTPDLPLAAAVILLTVPIYCGEAAGGMEPLALTSRDGKRLFARHKLVLALAVAAALSLSADLIRLAFFALKYGLPHGGWPMQSVESLGSAVKAMPLWGAEALAAGLRLLGSVELALLTLLFSALSGQFALSAFLGTAVTVLPWLGLRRPVQYALPFPSSLLAAIGFLQGSEVGTDAVTGQSAVVFREAGWGRLALIALGAILTGAVCALTIRRRYKTALSDGRGTGRRPAALCLGLLFCLTLGGCARAVSQDTVYNSRDHRTYVYNGLTVSFGDRELTVTDSSGNSTPLIRDALKQVSGAAYQPNFFAGGKYVYVWRNASEGYGQKLSSDTGKTYTVSLVRVDLETFASEVVFEKVTQHTVLGIDVPVEEAPGFLGGGGDFFVDGNAVYILDSGIRRVDLRTGKVSVLEIPTNHNVAFDGRFIYFMASGNILTGFDTKTGTTSALRDDPISDFRLTADGLEIT